MVVAGATSVSVALVLVVVPPLLVGAALGWYALRRFRPIAERALLGLERALDFLERGGIKPGHELPPARTGPAALIETIAGEIRNVIAASSERQRGK